MAIVVRIKLLDLYELEQLSPDGRERYSDPKRSVSPELLKCAVTHTLDFCGHCRA
jgi:hypothetical protein